MPPTETRDPVTLVCTVGLDFHFSKQLIIISFASRKVKIEAHVAHKGREFRCTQVLCIPKIHKKLYFHRVKPVATR